VSPGGARDEMAPYQYREGVVAEGDVFGWIAGDPIDRAARMGERVEVQRVDGKRRALPCGEIPLGFLSVVRFGADLSAAECSAEK